MNIVIYIFLICNFFIFTPGILFRISKNKYISAFIHGIIFAIFCRVFTKNLELFEEKKDPKFYLDICCNVVLDEFTPIYTIQDNKCISTKDKDYKE
jgi:hypothetical protein